MQSRTSLKFLASRPLFIFRETRRLLPITKHIQLVTRLNHHGHSFKRLNNVASALEPSITAAGLDHKLRAVAPSLPLPTSAGPAQDISHLLTAFPRAIRVPIWKQAADDDLFHLEEFPHDPSLRQDHQVEQDLVDKAIQALVERLRARNEVEAPKNAITEDMIIQAQANPNVHTLTGLIRLYCSRSHPTIATWESTPVNEPTHGLDILQVVARYPLPWELRHADTDFDFLGPSVGKENTFALMTHMLQKWKAGIFRNARRVGVNMQFRIAVQLPRMTNLPLEGIGFGPNKILAQEAALLQILSQLYQAGVIEQLFGPKDQPGMSKASNNVTRDVYNYAARYGAIAEVSRSTFEMAQPRGLRGSSQKQSSLVYQTSIKLPVLNIETVKTAEGLEIADMLAAAEFKTQVEHHRTGETRPFTTSHSILTTENAQDFLSFCRSMNKSFKFSYDVGNDGEKSAQAFINSKAAGPRVRGSSSGEAIQIAYLTAALNVKMQNPDIYAQWVDQSDDVSPNLMSPPFSIALPLPAGSLNLISNAPKTLPVEQRFVIADPLIEPAGQDWRRSSTTDDEALAESKYLLRRRDLIGQDRRSRHLREQAARLPIQTFSSKIIDLVNGCQYSIIVGTTGSGKTTQVPQILFDHEISQERGAYCNIICTQPRRIAATSVAQRVARERCERLGSTVGYHVRNDRHTPNKQYGITYCTTGILLGRLKHEADAVFDGASHIIVDEVHERDLQIDFLLIVLKKAIRQRLGEGKSVPRVVLMSATLDTEMFADYFMEESQEAVPVLNVPGRTFPVAQHYLDEVLAAIRITFGESDVKRFLADDEGTVEYLKAVEQGKGSVAAKAVNAPSVIDRNAAVPHIADAELQDDLTQSVVPIALTAATIAHLCRTTDDGAILVFLPGLAEIKEVQDTLLKEPFGIEFSNSRSFDICLLHSSVPKEVQNRVFEPSPFGCRRIILSTNIAETSVTVPDVQFVVDTGKLRETRYDHLHGITHLQCVWGSKSNIRQRAGRAGRVQAGNYYALFTEERFEAMPAAGQPELLRSDLQDTCLSIKARGFEESIQSFLSEAIEAPPPQAITTAISGLTQVEALTPDEQITSLGRVLALLPVRPSLGRMIILGILFKCLDPMVMLAVAASVRPLFTRPPGMRTPASQAHDTFVGDTQSDHFAFLAAFEELYLLEDDPMAQQDYAQRMFLHLGAFREIDQNTEQIIYMLNDAGLINLDEGEPLGYSTTELNANASNTDLLRGLLLAGFNSNLIVKISQTGHAYQSSTAVGVLLHHSSLNCELALSKTARKAGQGQPAGTLFTYDRLVSGDDKKTLFAVDTTHVTPLIATLFGGKLSMVDRAMLNGWLPFHLEFRQDAETFVKFQNAMQNVLGTAMEELCRSNGGEGNEDNEAAARRDFYTNTVVEAVLELLKRDREVPSGGIVRNRTLQTGRVML